MCKIMLYVNSLKSVTVDQYDMDMCVQNSEPQRNYKGVIDVRC